MVPYTQRSPFRAKPTVLRQFEIGNICTAAPSSNAYENSCWASRKLKDSKRCL